MITFDSSTEPSPIDADPWDTELARLRGRFPRANDSVLICIHTLQNAGDVSLDDLKARAALHGIRVTAASLNAARRAMGLAPPMGPRRRRAGVNGDAEEAEEPGGKLVEDRVPTRRRSPASGSRADDLEQALRRFVANADEERQRLREAIRRVIEVVDEVLG